MPDSWNAEVTPERPVPASARRSLVDELHLDEILLGVSVILAGIGIGVVNASTERALSYWTWVAPIFAATDAFLAWRHGSREARGDGLIGLLGRRILHWAAFLLAMLLLFRMVETGRLANDGAGLVALLLLGLTTFLAGVHGDPRLCVVGALLGGIAAGLAMIERFLWLLLLPAAALVVVLVLGRRRRSAAPTAAIP